MIENFAEIAIQEGGSIHPLLVPSDESKGLGLMNPSIINDNGTLRVILRNVNYTFYHSEKKIFQHQYGPLTYVHPENDMHLRTWNWYLELDDDLNVTRHNLIDTSKFDTYEPMWDFVGLEDARIMRWDDKLYISGVRRDTTTSGQGRMELSEINVLKDKVVEVSRTRIEPPNDPNSYCEKNWVPVLDKPFHYVKWSNPTELVKVEGSKSIAISTTKLYKDLGVEPRGGTQVIPWGDKYITMAHEVELFNSEVGRKDAVYKHRFLIWDKNFNLVDWSEDFLIMGGHVEFAIGMCYHKEDMLITFGFQDNAAYILRVKPKTIENFINGITPA